MLARLAFSQVMYITGAYEWGRPVSVVAQCNLTVLLVTRPGFDYQHKLVFFFPSLSKHLYYHEDRSMKD